MHLLSVITQDASNALLVLILGENMCLQCCSKLVITKHWVTVIVRRRVSGHRADNRKCLMTELAVTMSWKDELVAADRVKTLTADNIRTRCAGVHQVLGCPVMKTPVNGLSKLDMCSSE